MKGCVRKTYFHFISNFWQIRISESENTGPRPCTCDNLNKNLYKLQGKAAESINDNNI